MKRPMLVGLAVGLLMGVIAVPIQAQGIDSFFDVFWVELGGNAGQWNVVTAGGGSGADGGAWISYAGDPGTAVGQEDPWGAMNPVPGWVNQWYYDGRFRPERYKVVEVSFAYALLDPGMNGGANIVINWSLPEWSLNAANAGQFPRPQDEPFIGRAVVGAAWLGAGDEGVYQFDGVFDLREFGVPFNPEWVSIDVAGYNVMISDSSLPGSFNHHCIPEPLSAALLLWGSLGVLAIARRARR